MRAIVAVACVGAFVHVADARPAQITWQDICVFALGVTDEDRVELETLAGTNIDGGLYRTNTAGLVARYQVSDALVAIVDTRVLFAHEREPLPMVIASPRRQSVIAVELGVIPVTGKFAIGDTKLVYFDVIAAAGPGFVERSNVAWLAASYGVTLRARLTDWLTLDLGVHDDYVGWQALAGRTMDTARTSWPPPQISHAIEPAAHDVEVRVGLGMWLPPHPRRKCRIHCS